MIKHHDKGGKAWGLLAALALALVPVLPAQAAQGIGISPTGQEIDVDAGRSYTGSIMVLNDGTNDVTYRFVVSDYRVQDESYDSLFTSTGASNNVSAVSWFSLPTGNQVIKAGQQVPVRYTVTVPPGASVGGHYAAVFIETVPPTGPGGNRINRVDRIGSLMYIAVGGNLQRSGQVLPLEVPWLQAVGPLKASVRLRNDGNVHLAAEGYLQLSSLFGKVGDKVPFKGRVLPQTTRRFEVSLPASSPIGLFKVTAHINYLDRSEEVSHWVLLVPRVTFIIVSGTLLLLLAAGLWWLWHRLKSRSES